LSVVTITATYCVVARLTCRFST